MKRIITIAALLFYSVYSMAQGFAINIDGSSADTSSILHVKSNSKGILIPKMTQAERNAISNPAQSLLLYQTDFNAGFYYNNGTPSVPNWTRIANNNNTWQVTGNSGINPSANFIGNTDNQPLRFRVANQFSGELSTSRTFFGYMSGSTIPSIGTGANNTAYGSYSLGSFTTGEGNVVIGTAAMGNSSTASYNIAIGKAAMLMNASGNNNTAAGYEAMELNTKGNDNTAIGFRALINNDSANYNTAIGSGSMSANTRGLDNTAVGHISLFNNFSGSGNSALGRRSLYSNTTGNDNTGIGFLSLQNNSTASANTAVGNSSLRNNSTGPGNTAIGNVSLTVNTTGTQNTAIGAESLSNNITGNNNTAAGTTAGNNNVTGNQNSFIGYKSNNIVNTVINNSTAIGAYSTVNISDAVVIGAIANINSATVTAKTGIGINAPQARLHVVNNLSTTPLINAGAIALFEDINNNYIQTGSGASFETGIISSTPATDFRSGVIFSADGSLQLRTGGNTTNAILSAAGNLGIGIAAPTAAVHAGGAIAITPQSFVIGGGAQTINPGNRSFIKIYNNSNISATITLGNGVADGQLLTILVKNPGSGSVQFLDAPLTNNTELSILFIMGDNDVLNLIWDNSSNNWVELNRSIN